MGSISQCNAKYNEISYFLYYYTVYSIVIALSVGTLFVWSDGDVQCPVRLQSD